MKKINYCIFLMLFVVTCGFAQSASTYTFSQSNGTYTPITGGTLVNSATTANGIDSYLSPQQTFPVSVYFGGAYYTNCYISSNGSISLGTETASAYTTSTLSSTFGSNAVIAPFTADLSSAATGTSEIRWEQVGNEIVIQWDNFRRYNKTESFSFQARINSVTGVVSFVYKGTPPYDTSTQYQPQVGIKTSTGDGNAMALTVAADGSWNTPTVLTSGIVSGSTAAFRGATGFTEGLTYSFTPPAPCSGTPDGGATQTVLTRSVCAGTAPGVITVTGASAPVPGITYQWEESTDNGTTWVNATGGSNATTTSYTPPSFAGTAIKYRMKTTCSNGGGSAVSDITTINPAGVPDVQASAITISEAIPTQFKISWTNGNGNRRLVYVSTSPITDPASGTGMPATNPSTTFANTGQQLVYDFTGSFVVVKGLECNQTYYVKVYEYYRCGNNPYDMYINTTTGSNAISAPNVTTAALPVANDFTGFTGANLQEVTSPVWYEARITTGNTVPAPINSGWINSTVLGSRTAKINLYDDDKNDWIISPKMAITEASRIKFKAAITNYNSSNEDPDSMQGTDDKVNLMISTDCGATWTAIYTFEAANTTTLTNALQNFNVLIPVQYIGQDIHLAFQGIDGPIENDPNDYDFHIGDLLVQAVPSCDKPVLAATTNITKNSATINWNAPATGVPTGYEYVVSTSDTAPTGSGTATTATTADVSSLMPSTTYYVFVRTVCGTEFSQWSDAGTFGTLCNHGDITGTTPGSRCGAGTVQLSGTSTGTLYWFAAATGGSPLGSGDTFTTPELTETTDFYASSAAISPGTAIQAGMGTTTSNTYSNPFYGSWSNNHTQHLITAQELLDAGLVAGSITSIALDVAEAGTRPMIDLTIKIGASASTAMTAFADNSGFSTVYTNASYMPVPGINNFTFTAPFNWDGTSNIIVEFCHGNGSSGATMSRTVKTDPTSYVATVQSDRFAATSGSVMCGDTTTNLTTYSSRPVFIFTGTGTCYGPRTVVTATINTPPAFTLSPDPAGVCAGQTTDLVTITDGAADYDTFVWTPSTGVSGSAAQGWTFNPAVTTAYSLQASNSGSGCNANPVMVRVTINPNPTPMTVTNSANGGICIGQAATLTASGGTLSASGTIGEGTTTTSSTNELTAFCNRRNSLKSQMIYTAAELNAVGIQAGPINSIAFHIASIGDGSFVNDYSVKIGATAGASFANTTYIDNSNFTTVYGPVTYNQVIGWNTITFTTPYMWDGASNIVIEVNQSGANDIDNAETYYTATAQNTVLYSYNNPAAITGTTSANRFNIRLESINPVTMAWSPSTGLYSDAAATMPYAGENTAVVYVKPASPDAVTYTVTSTSNAGCSVTATTNVTVNITPAPTVAAPTQDICYEGTIADLMANGTDIKWYAAENGGNPLAATTALVDDTAYYASQTVNGCESADRTMLTANINTVAAPTVAAPTQDICYEGTIADLMANGTDIKWYATENGGNPLAATTALVDDTAYYASQTVNGCESADRTMLTANINTVAAPGGETMQQITVGNAEEATIEDIVVTAEGTVTWYATEADALAGENALAAGTQLVSGNTYYGTQTIGACESATAIGVTVDVVLGNDKFNHGAFRYHPNPVKDVLNISYTSEIGSVTVFDLLGQQVISKQPNATEVKIDLSGLADATYIVNVVSGNTTKTIKVVKHQ